MTKGQGSLLAIVLIIAFTVIIGATTYLFSQRITEERIEEVEENQDCSNINIKILEACFDAQIRIKLESKTSKQIDKGFLIRTIGDTTFTIPSLPFTVLDGLDIEDIIVPYNTEMNNIQEIMVIPKIRDFNGEQSICYTKADKTAINPC